MIKVLIVTVKLAIHPLLVIILISTSTTAASALISIIATITLFIFLMVIVSITTLLLVWICHPIVDTLLLVGTIASAASILLYTTFRGTILLLVILDLLLTLALNVAVLPFGGRCHAI